MTDFEFDALDGVTEKFVAILGHRFRYFYRIMGSINIGRVIDVYTVILHIIYI